MYRESKYIVSKFLFFYFFSSLSSSKFLPVMKNEITDRYNRSCVRS